MWTIISKALIAALVPKVVENLPKLIEDAFNEAIKEEGVLDSIKDFFFSDEEKDAYTNAIQNRGGDRTKFTQWDYDIIKLFHTQREEYNAGLPQSEKFSMEELVDRLNIRLCLNKSRTSYGVIWNNHVNRDSLAVGSDPQKYERSK